VKFTRITDAEMTTQEEEEEEESLTLKRTKKIKIKRTFDFSKYKTRKIALELAYCGANHFGFSSQGCVQASSENTTNAKNNSHIRTIEGALFEALKKCRLVDPSKEIFGEPSVDYSRCGRTDRGVSSIGNVVSLNVRCKGVGGGGGGEDEEDDEDGENGEEIDYVGNLNRALPDDVRALCWYAVPDGFSSRFNCTSRRYEYHFTRVVRQNLAPPPRGGEEAGKCEPEEILDVERMREACEKLVGTHDFRNFCKMNVKDCRDYTRHIKECRIEKKNTERTTGALLRETDWVLIIEGSSFLWHMVRCIAAVLFQVGLRADAPDIIDELLDLTKTPRKPLYAMAPEHSLVLVGCEYDDSVINPGKRRVSEEARQGLEMHALAAARMHRLKASLWEEIGGRAHSPVKEDADTPSHNVKRSRELTRGLLSSTNYGTAAGEPKGEPVSLKKRSTEKTYDERIADLNAKNERKKTTEAR
jgi:tRNA pseudouridine38/39 synthase